VHLATARLAFWELHLMAEPLQQRHGRPPDVRIQRVRQARNEESNPHEFHHVPSAHHMEVPGGKRGQDARLRSLLVRR
jgi:hypothetical protein